MAEAQYRVRRKAKRGDENMKERQLGRKGLLGVLSIAGLLATLLAVTGGVSAQSGSDTKNGTITSDNFNGVYTVEWTAKGNCTPNLNGSRTITVTDGTTRTAVYTINGNCVYNWVVTYVAGKVSNFDHDADTNTDAVSLTEGNECAAKAAADADGATLTNADYEPESGLGEVHLVVDHEDCVVEMEITVDVVGGQVVDNEDATTLNRSAVRAKTWTVTVERTGKGKDGEKKSASDKCQKKLEQKTEKVTVADVERQQAKFTLITQGTKSPSGSTLDCQYKITVVLQNGFEEFETDSAIIKEWDGTDEEGESDNELTLTLKVASREVYVVQKVAGDPAGALVEYTSSISCRAEDEFELPERLSVAREDLGAIQTTDAQILVPLVKGEYDVTEGLAGAMASTVSSTAGRPAIGRTVLDAAANPCVIDLTVTGIPANCKATVTPAGGSSSNAGRLNLATAKPQNIITFSFNCSETTTPATVEGEPSGATADGEVGAGTGDGTGALTSPPAPPSSGAGEGGEPGAGTGDGAAPESPPEEAVTG